MSPRKERYQTPEWMAQSIRNRRKNLLFGSYNCPQCSKKMLKIEIDSKKKKVVAVCNCGLDMPLKYCANYQPVDYYGKLIDTYHKE